MVFKKRNQKLKRWQKRILNNYRSFRDYQPKVINYEIEKSISYSQTLAYNTCPHQWALSYIKKASRI
jgi:hypothetical protein